MAMEMAVELLPVFHLVKKSGDESGLVKPKESMVE
jgi:hypothetical protein